MACGRVSPSRISTVRIAGASAVVRTKLAGAPGSTLAGGDVTPGSGDTVGFGFAQEISAQASRSGGRRIRGIYIGKTIGQPAPAAQSF